MLSFLDAKGLLRVDLRLTFVILFGSEVPVGRLNAQSICFLDSTVYPTITAHHVNEKDDQCIKAHTPMRFPTNWRIAIGCLCCLGEGGVGKGRGMRGEGGGAARRTLLAILAPSCPSARGLSSCLASVGLPFV